MSCASPSLFLYLYICTKKKHVAFTDLKLHGTQMHIHICIPNEHTEIPMSLDLHSTFNIISDVLLLKK